MDEFEKPVEASEAQEELAHTVAGVGLGTYLAGDSRQTKKAVLWALDAG